MEKTRIMVVPAFSGAGASFTAASLAVFLAGRTDEKARRAKGLPPRVTLAEPAGGDLFSALGMEERFVNRSFESFTGAIEKGESLKDICNARNGVNCLFRVPGRDGDLSLPGLFRLISSAPGEIVVFDCSGLDREVLKDAAAEAEKRVLVIDPLPVRLIENGGFIGRFLLRFPDTVTVVNKMNSGVRKAELDRYLGRRTYVSLPCLPAETVYKAQYNCLSPAELEEGREQLTAPMEALIKKLELFR
ncbi:MAG: hypothetical protein IJM17_09340 [Firmicutes bacterium]|nr:hypothetical protein [Bacillota bacterium]